MSIRLGAVLGVCAAGKITNVTQPFQPAGRFWLAKFPIAFEIEITLPFDGQGNDEFELRPGARHLRLEAAHAIGAAVRSAEQMPNMLSSRASQQDGTRMNAMTRRRTAALIRRGQGYVQPAMTLRRLLLPGLVALGMTAATVATATAQPFTGASAGSAVGQAYALAARIRGFHRWTGSTPPPAAYCSTMRAGEAIMVELARLSNRAIRYHQPGLALELQRAGDRLGDELDEEEAINDQAGIPYSGYPCLIVQPSYPSRAAVLAFVEPRVPRCRRKADAARASFDARRALMYQCLRLAGS